MRSEPPEDGDGRFLSEFHTNIVGTTTRFYRCWQFHGDAGLVVVRAMFDLTGRTAVVTGAAPGGLGYAAARALRRAGAQVMLSDLPDLETELFGGCQALGSDGEVTYAVADLTREADVAALAASALQAWGKVDVLVHVAGVMQRRPTLDTSQTVYVDGGCSAW